MTVSQVLEALERLKPSGYPLEARLMWLGEIEHRVFEELCKTHPGFGPQSFAGFGPATPPDTPLIVDGPHADVYLRGLMAEVDLMNADLDRYQASRCAFDDKWAALAAHVNRAHRPAQGAIVRA